MFGIIQSGTNLKRRNNEISSVYIQNQSVLAQFSEPRGFDIQLSALINLALANLLYILLGARVLVRVQLQHFITGTRYGFGGPAKLEKLRESWMQRPESPTATLVYEKPRKQQFKWDGCICIRQRRQSEKQQRRFVFNSNSKQ